MLGVTALRAVSGGAAGRTFDGFEVAWLAEDGDQHRSTLTDVWATRFEWCQPARRFPSYKGQRHFNGRWWSSTMGQHVGYESWLERDHLMLLDHDPSVVAVASQPFWLFWPAGEDKVRSHVPDYFARLADGGALVVDCRPVERIKPKDMAAFEATRAACELVGWQYRLAGARDAIVVANVRWLSGYRHPRHDLPAVAGPLRQVFSQPYPLMAGAERVGDPIGVLPVLFHLLWRHELTAELSVPLHPDTMVRAAAPVAA
jgi:hypothetical protein